MVETFNKLKRAVPGVLDKSPFGRSSHQAFWVEARSIAQVAAFLKEDADTRLDWLENLSVFQMDETLVVNYFLRSSTLPHGLVVRSSVVLVSQTKEVEVASVCDVWKMAEPFEIEIQDLFGIRFLNKKGTQAHAPNQTLPKGWNGFPLRKNYVFPTQFLGISHTRRTETRGRS